MVQNVLPWVNSVRWLPNQDFFFLTSYSLHVPGDFQNETEITLKETLLLGLLSMGGVNGVKR